MPRIQLPDVNQATGASADVFASIQRAVGRVPNAYATIGSVGANYLKAILSTDAQLANGSLSKQELEIIRITISELAGCEYCVAAHHMLGKMSGLTLIELAQIRQGQPTGNERKDALASFVRVVHQTKGTLSQQDFAAIRTAGFDDQQLVEISLAIALITFSNVFNRINDTTIDFPAVD